MCKLGIMWHVHDVTEEYDVRPVSSYGRRLVQCPGEICAPKSSVENPIRVFPISALLCVYDLQFCFIILRHIFDGFFKN